MTSLRDPGGRAAGWSPSRLGVTVDSTATGHTVHLSGEIDLVNAAQLAEVFARLPVDGGLTALVVEVSALEFIDVAGLRALADAARRAAAVGGPMTLQGARPFLRRIVAAAHFDDVIVFRETPMADNDG